MARTPARTRGQHTLGPSQLTPFPPSITRPNPRSTPHRPIMFGYFNSPTPSTSTSPAPPPVPAEPAIRTKPTFDQLVQEEVPIQSASVAMEGGMPSCLTLFDNFLLCYCKSPLSLGLSLAEAEGLPNPQRSPRRDCQSTATAHPATALPSLRTSSSA